VGGSHGKTTTTSMIMHVLKKAGKDFDYLVGARLEGFDQSVNISNAPLIVCEGDGYPASVLEKRPKFHFLFPHIAIITGIAWDHINVFPTFEFYLEQFRIFIDKITPGGCLIYNETDEILKKLVKEHPSAVERIPYGLPQHQIRNGKTLIRLEDEEGELKVFGNHNLLNLHAAYLACKQVGIDAKTFVNKISSFTGASKRLELLVENSSTNVYRDFAHAPSKVRATIEAVKQQFPSRKLIAALELHTFSSLNEQFMNEYRGTMDAADDPATRRRAGDLLHLGLAIDREQTHAQLESLGDLALFLDRIAVGDAIGGGARGERRVGFGDRGHIEAAAEIGQQLKDFRRRIRLHGVIHFRVRQRLGEVLIVLADDIEIDNEAGSDIGALLEEFADACGHCYPAPNPTGGVAAEMNLLRRLRCRALAEHLRRRDCCLGPD